MNSAFDPKNQELNIDSKIVVALERIGEAFKVSLWNENKKYGLSPTQLQILIFLLFHPEKLRTISQLANEFNTTKASISDSVKTLENKGFIFREKNKEDYRKSTLILTEEGTNLAIESAKFADEILETISDIPSEKKELFLETLIEIIHKLFNKGIISIQRMCLTCNYYVKDSDSDEYSCTLMHFPIKKSELRLDCNEYK